MTFFYNIGIFFYRLSIFIASFFNEKAKKWIAGRRDVFEKIEEKFNNQRTANNEQIIWFHCASLGEFEQGRPLIEKLKTENSKLKILVTFFSPSGYEIRKNYKGADYVFYLPMDSKANAEKFLEIINPSIAVFVKYEFWFHYLSELNKRRVPTFLISANFREEQIFFKWYGSFFRQMLKFFTHIFVQNENSKKLLEKINIQNVSVSGDTRFDRVFSTMQASEEIPLIEKFKNGKKLLIAGSTWEEDEKIISNLKSQISPQNDGVRNFVRTNLKLIIAPHEVNEKNIQRIVGLFPNSIRYSHLTTTNNEQQITNSCLIIDNVGMLSRLYRYGDIAYVGGAFGKSLHNILEPAAFGLPVLFGPNHQKFREAAELIEKGGAFSIANSKELNKKIKFLLHDEMILKIASEMSRNFVRSNIGATQKIMEKIQKILFL